MVVVGSYFLGARHLRHFLSNYLPKDKDWILCSILIYILKSQKSHVYRLFRRINCLCFKLNYKDLDSRHSSQFNNVSGSCKLFLSDFFFSLAVPCSNIKQSTTPPENCNVMPNAIKYQMNQNIPVSQKSFPDKHVFCIL